MSKHAKPRVYLSDADKTAIRKSKFSPEYLAANYNVAVNTIYAVIRSNINGSNTDEKVVMTKDEYNCKIKLAESRGILTGYNKCVLDKEQIVRNTLNAIMLKFGTVKLDEVKITEINEFQQELIDKLKAK